MPTEPPDDPSIQSSQGPIRSTASASGAAAPLVTLGWREIVSLPGWEIGRIRAKLDTGARTSALHVERIDELEDGRIAFDAVVRERPKKRVVRVVATPVRTTVVKPSSGERQQRVVCRTLMRIGPIEREVEVTLVCRRGMLCRMLVGRSALAGVATVDPGHRYLVSSPKRRRQDRTTA